MGLKQLRNSGVEGPWQAARWIGLLKGISQLKKSEQLEGLHMDLIQIITEIFLANWTCLGPTNS